MNWFTSWFTGGKTATKASPKAVAFGTKMMLGGGLPGGWSSDHREEANHYTGFNYIAITAIANQYAGADVEVYSDGADMRKASVAKSRRKTIRRKHHSVARFKSNYGLDEKETTPLDHDHPLVQLLKNPNPYEPGFNFRMKQAIQLRLTGTCFIWNVPGKGGKTVERYVMPTSMLTPVRPQPDMPMGGYRVSAYSSRYIGLDDQGFVEGSPTFMSVIGSTIDARQVQVIRLPHAWWFDDGQSPVSACAKHIDLEEGVNTARIGQLRNGADPSLYIELPEDVSPDQDEMDRVTQKMNQKYSGPENTGKIMIGMSGSSVTPLSTNPKDMCYAEGFQDAKASVLALHNTPEVAVGLAPPGAYAAYYASMLAWRTSAIQPMCDMFAESDTMHLASQFGEGLTIEVEAPMVDDKDQEMKELQTAGQLGLLTVNEGRARLGLPPLKDGKGEEMAGAAKPAPGANSQDQQVDNNTANFPTTPYGKSATLQAAIDAAEEGDIEWLATKLKAYDASEARDSDGKWTSSGGDSDISPKRERRYDSRGRLIHPTTGQVQALRGGEVSEVDGQPYVGGRWMPVHGLTPKLEKKPARVTSASDALAEANERKEPSKRIYNEPRVMSPEEIEAEKVRRTERAQWNEVKEGPFGKLMNLGDSPGRVFGSGGLKQWREFAETHGEEAISELADKLRGEQFAVNRANPEYSKYDDHTLQELIDEHNQYQIDHVSNMMTAKSKRQFPRLAEADVLLSDVMVAEGGPMTFDMLVNLHKWFVGNVSNASKSYRIALGSISALKSHWITIHQHGDDGKGVHVELNDAGEITKGPEGFTGKHISELSAEHRHSQKLIPHAHEFMSKQHEEWETAKQNARKITGLHAGDIARHENAYRDHSSVENFDTASREAASQNPALGLNPEDHDTPAKLWEIIREGKRKKPSINSPEVRELAQQWAKGNKQTQTHETFAHDDDWDFKSLRKSFNPSESRDSDGKWTGGNGENKKPSTNMDEDFGNNSDIRETLYSGSHQDFDSFNDHSYLTPDRDIAGQYGKHVVSAKVDVKNVFRPDSIEEIAEASGVEPLEENRFVFEELDRQSVREGLRKNGYDAVQFKDVAPNSPGDKTHSAVIVFSGKDVKKVGKEKKSLRSDKLNGHTVLN